MDELLPHEHLLSRLPPNPKQAYGNLKVPLGLIPAGGLIPIAMALKQGAEKYGAFNWRDHPVEAMTYHHAMLRHGSCWVDREDIDPESGILHLGHLGASVVILLDAINIGTLIDNRPTRGRAADLLREYAQRS